MNEQVAQATPALATSPRQASGLAFDKFAGAAAVLVALSSIAYGFVYLFLVPAEQKGPPPDLLTSFASNPAGRQIASVMLVLGGLGAATAAVGIYLRLREQSPRWAAWSVRLGFAYGLLTTLHGFYLIVLFPVMSGLYVNAPPAGVTADAIKGGAVALGNLPSPLDPYGFSKFILCGIWLLVTGALLLRSQAFVRWLGWLAVVGGVGLLLLFIGNVTGTKALLLATGVPGTVIIGPLFWLVVGYSLWTKSAKAP
jgi:hypothetical protein